MPDHLWRRVRTANPPDRFFKEIRRRFNPIGAFLDRPSASRILFALSNVHNENQLEKETKAPRAISAKFNSAHL
jgi:transposase-like protein